MQGLQWPLADATPELWLSLVSLLVKMLEAVVEIQTIADVGLLWHLRQPIYTKSCWGSV